MKFLLVVVGLSTAILIHVFDFYLQSVYEYLEMQGIFWKLANYSLRNGTVQLQGHTIRNKYNIIIFVVVHLFSRNLSVLLITSLFS